LTTDLPPELAAFSSLLDAQPAPVRAMFNYCLAMVVAGKARLVETVPGENGPVCTFETAAGERLSLTRPLTSEEAKVRERFGEILGEDRLSHKPFDARPRPMAGFLLSLRNRKDWGGIGIVSKAQVC
jgi:hypothetical protein